MAVIAPERNTTVAVEVEVYDADPRSLGGGFGTLDESGLGGSVRYRVVLWPASAADSGAVKPWERPG